MTGGSKQADISERSPKYEQRHFIKRHFIKGKATHSSQRSNEPTLYPVHDRRIHGPV
ncbi:protein of unknown function [Limnospira indica PCC 8005]|uniref:Uncharacterized protein n=1 Tax=Limnospira indica PCC 8005 TaxID=376219 RepID=A0A9P1KJ21_9CYAN|nr:protein of unknown function [Limnospira indica PCC 8005]